MLRREIHEGGERRLAESGGALQRNLIFAIKFEREQASGGLGNVAAIFEICSLQKSRRQFHANGFHASKLLYR